MTQLVFLELFEQYEEGKSYNIERTLANGLCKRKIAVTFTEHQKMLKETEQKKEEAESEKKAELLKAKKKAESDKADSKKVKQSEKAVKNNL